MMTWTAWSALSASLATLTLSAPGCAHSWYVKDADREVGRLLHTYNQRVLGDRDQWVRQPEPEGDQTKESAAQTLVSPDEIPADPAPEPLMLDLTASLEIAYSSGRDYLSRKEELYLQGLGFSLVRHNFGPILASTISYVWHDVEAGTAYDVQEASASVTDTLPTGAQLSLSSNLTGTRTDDPNFLDTTGTLIYDTSARISLRQPLLRGAGYEVSHEALTQSERDLIDAVRRFELFRQDYSIRVADAYYSLVSRKTRLANDDQNYQDAVFDRKKAKALRQVDRNRDDDVFLARRREIDAEDALLVAQTDYRFVLDDFKILLGLPTATEIAIGDDAPEFRAVRLDAKSAIEVAHYNRLDLHALRDQLGDAERRVRVSDNDLLPDLSLTIGAALEPEASESTPHRSRDRRTVSVGLELDLPLDRKAERNAYRSALIALDQARRDLRQRLDEVERDVLNQLRELEQLEKRLQLQTDQIAREKRAVAVTQIRYESGDVDNRDLLDARQGLTDAQNTLVELKVQHFVAGLRLRRNLGILFIGNKGMWQQ